MAAITNPSQGYIDYSRELTAYTFIALTIFYMSKFVLMMDWQSRTWFRIYDANQPLKPMASASVAGAMSFLCFGTLVALQITAWAKYNMNNSSLTFPVDIYNLVVSFISFAAVGITYLMAASSLMIVHNQDTKGEGKNARPLYSPSYKGAWVHWVNCGINCIQYLSWIGYYVFTGFLVFRYLDVNGGDFGSAQTTLQTAGAVTLTTGCILAFNTFLVAWERAGSVPHDLKSSVYNDPEFEVKAAKDLGACESFGSKVLPRQGTWPIFTPAQETNAISIISTLLYHVAVVMLVYLDYYQFLIAALFVVIGTIYAYSRAKSIEAFWFYFFYALWFSTTLPYLIGAIYRQNTDPSNNFLNQVINLNPLLLRPSQVVLPSDFLPSIILVYTLAFAAACLQFAMLIFPYVRGTCSKYEDKAAVVQVGLKTNFEPLAPVQSRAKAT